MMRVSALESYYCSDGSTIVVDRQWLAEAVERVDKASASLGQQLCASMVTASGRYRSRYFMGSPMNV